MLDFVSSYRVVISMLGKLIIGGIELVAKISTLVFTSISNTAL